MLLTHAFLVRDRGRRGENGPERAYGTGIAVRLVNRCGLSVDVVSTIGNEKMSRTDNIVDLINAGIRAENLRQKAIADNFANLETPGYRRVDVKFEELLAACSGKSGSDQVGDAEPELYEPRQTPLNAKGNDLSLEAEVGHLIKNSLRHKAYIRLLSRKYAQIEMAIGTR